jgi:predicted molibdopterin-dependent oxidoreductase YjgC
MFDPIVSKIDTNTQVHFIFDGESIYTAPNTSVAAALLAAGHTCFRQTPVSGQQRGPFCMMGTCFDCMVEIDGITVQACVTTVTEGLNVARAPLMNLQEGKFK